jgi:nucleoside-diphosphate-sugar epimerase
MNILITGGEGYVASNLYKNLESSYNLTTISRKDLDLTISSEVNAFFENKFFDIVFHCAVCGGSRLKLDSYYEMDNNLKMYYNLHQLKDKHFKKFITFGSGAETHSSHTPYGLSKHVIAQSISETENFYNLVIFALFDSSEWESRFIKANILRYINKDSIIIHQDKYMDFFYMNDFIKVIKYYIENQSCPKSINFSYGESTKLSDIAKKINNLNNYKVDICIENQEIAPSYCGDYNLDALNINFDGLYNGIEKVFDEINSANYK